MEETTQTTEAATEPVAEKKTIWESGLQQLLLGLAIIGFAAYYYFEITKLETEGGSVRMNRIFIIVYELAGKNVSVGIGVILGLVFSGLGIKGLLEYFKKK